MQNTQNHNPKNPVIVFYFETLLQLVDHELNVLARIYTRHMVDKSSILCWTF